MATIWGPSLTLRVSISEERRRFLQTVGLAAATAAARGWRCVAAGEEPADSLATVREKTLRFIESLRVADGPYGRYRYAAGIASSRRCTVRPMRP